MNARSRRRRDAAAMAALAVVYVIAARVGLSLGAVNSVATSVWPPTGICLAVLLLLGFRLWPGITCGAFLANWSVGVPVVAAAGIATGNTLEALCGAYLLQRILGFRNSLERIEDVLGLVILAATLSTALSASIGVTTAWLGGVVPSAGFGGAWWTWWVGDALGDLVIAPALLVWSTRPRLRWSAPRAVEAVALVSALVIVCLLIFNVGSHTHPGPYVVFPVLVWAALRFRQFGATAVTLVLSAIAIWCTAQGWGPFAQQTVPAGLVHLQAFMGVAAVTVLVLGAAITERKAVGTDLRRLASEVEQQARTLEAILSASPDHVYTFDEAGRYTYASLAGARAMGLEPSDIVGKTSHDLGLPAEVLTRTAKQRAAVFATGQSLAGEARLPTRKGPRDFDYTLSPIPLADGRVGAMLVTARDITERKQAEEALQESEARYRQLVEMSPDAIAVHCDGKIAFVNSAGVRLLGASSPVELVGRPILEFIHPDFHALALQRVNQMLHEHKPAQRVEEKFLRLDGSTVDVEVVAMGVTYQNQPAVQVVVHDITQRKEAEAAVRRSETHFRTLIENGLDLIAVADHTGLFRYASPSNQRVLGYAPEELVGKNAFDFFHPDDAAHIQSVFVGAAQHPGVTPTVEFRFRHKDGSWRFIEAIGNAVRNDSGGIEVVINSRDITDRKHAEQALQEEAHVSQALAYVGRELIASLDQPTALARLCQVTVEVLAADLSHTSLFDPQSNAYQLAAGHGYTAEVWESLRILKIPQALMDGLLSWMDHHEAVQLRVSDFPNPLLRTHALQFGISHGLFVRLRRGSESMGVHAVYRREPTPFSDQQLRIARGVAQLASLALDHARVVAELEGANRVKSDFVATMSHELRTPLNVITGYTDLLLDGGFGALATEQSDVLQRVDKSARELLNLINVTLDLSRLETGRVPLEIRGVQLADLFDEVQNETRELQNQSGLQFIWNADADLPLLHTDALKVKVVLKNLIGNAVKFTDRGSISIGARHLDDGVEIAVADTGIGIQPDAQQIIFDAFRQGDGSSTRGYGGVGLGLYIVRRLLDVLGGTVTVESTLGRGSTFRVWLPQTKEGTAWSDAAGY